MVMLSVQDNVGFIFSCIFIVELKDVILFDVVCLVDIMVSNDFGLCSVVVDFSFVLVSDNCDNNFDISYSQDLGIVFDVGIIIVMIIVKDDFDNLDDCSFFVIVNDMEDLIFSNCLGNIFVNNDIGDCGVNVNWILFILSDNCLGVLFNSMYFLDDFFFVGIMIVIYFGSDVVGNDVMDCSFMVMVIDNEKFDIVCLSNIIISNDFG